MIECLGYALTQIEHLETLRNNIDSIDLSDNKISVIENIPKLTRLKVIFLANNKISAIQSDFAACVPNLEILVLHNNKIQYFDELLKLRDLKQLKIINLSDNLVTEIKDYRLKIISLFSSLYCLDFERVTLLERKASENVSIAVSSEIAEAKRSKRSKIAAISSIESKILNATSNAELEMLEEALKKKQVTNGLK